ncbi:FKBP-type peptidyl-prolyl cis-trans isomerase [uncultured Microscilla sp.]|uniref:FKBP-type peptidyl-prolyl cis-trans isomerase n=1 Tax=uncultured Microscilla sp. TaxID=432653 RepID=UPI00261FD52B|nr:FKBP-type peptidyl-prolyl cis-trans isomerase [uncultured Microscilla sp.]
MVNNHWYNWIIIFACVVAITACADTPQEEGKTQNGWVKPRAPKQTKSGIKYQIFVREKNSVKIQNNLLVTYHQVIKNHKDSTLNSSYLNGVKKQIPFKSPYFSNYYKEMFQLLAEGDSATFWVPCKLLTTTKNTPLPYFLQQDKEIQYTVKILKVESKETIKKNLEKNKQAQLEIEDKLIANFLEKKKTFTPKKTPSGLYYFIEKEGKGKKPNTGDTVSVHYVGKLLDGTVFSSIQEGETFEFPLGQDPPAVIPGWEEAITLMHKGSRGTFIFPSHLAYGTKGSRDGVPPNAIVVFNVELVDVK